MNDFLPKPVDPDALYRCLQRWLPLPVDGEAPLPPPSGLARLPLAAQGKLDLERAAAVTRNDPERLQKLLGMFAESHARDLQRLHL